MSDFETEITLSVLVDPDYHYEVSTGGTLNVTYVEHRGDSRSDISFGSIEEMESVAKAMLKVVTLHKKGDSYLS